MEYFNRIAIDISRNARIPYIYGVLLALGTLAFWGVEYAFNKNGIGAFSTYATIVTDVVIFVVGMAPLYLAYAGEVGVILAIVNGRDPRAGAANAIGTYFKFVLWLVFANTLVGLSLATIVFGDYFESTGNVFWNLILLIVAAVIFGYMYDFGAGLKRKFITGFLVLVAGILLWNYIGKDNRDAAMNKLDSATEAAKSIGGASTADATDCPKDERCVATDGYEVDLSANETLYFRLGVTASETGLEAKVTDPALRALVHDSKLFTVNQQLGTGLFSIRPNPAGFAKYVKGDTLHLKMYPLGSGAKMVAAEFGTFNAGAIDITS